MSNGMSQGSISLFQDEVSLTPRKVAFIVDSPRGTLRVKALIDQALFWASGEQLREDAAEMVRGLLNLPHVVKMTLTEAHNHPERENLRYFQFHTGFPETLQLYLREDLVRRDTCVSRDLRQSHRTRGIR
jgi:hypothetical protein